jgi:hypothetical protein
VVARSSPEVQSSLSSVGQFQFSRPYRLAGWPVGGEVLIILVFLYNWLRVFLVVGVGSTCVRQERNEKV